MEIRKLRLNRYGWKPDKPDHRDYKFTVPKHFTAKSLPSSVNLRSGFPEPYDQKELCSSTGQAISSLIQYNLMKEDISKAFQPASLFIYYNGRVLENCVNEDAGIEIRDGIKSTIRWGICPEQYYPHIISKFKVKPSKFAYSSVVPHRIDQYARINQVETDLKSCLAEESPFVFGFSVYESFESKEVIRTGIVPMPSKSERLLGGHAVCCVGYNDVDQRFLVRNSQGASWGMDGYFTIPYEYLFNPDLSNDFWTIKFIPR